MTNHIHMIISSNGSNRQEEIIRDFKKHTSTKCVDLIKSNIEESRKNWMLWMFQSAGKKNSNNKSFQFW
jgi:putative transposase